MPLLTGGVQSRGWHNIRWLEAFWGKLSYKLRHQAEIRKCGGSALKKLSPDVETPGLRYLDLISVKIFENSKIKSSAYFPTIFC